jgi:uncharacterized protein (DUF1810 family)
VVAISAKQELPGKVNKQPRDPADPWDLNRFVQAQNGVYERALAELSAGQKRTHWMWFIFPQIDGLGFSSTTRFYAIKSVEEAHLYLDHPRLGSRLRACVEAILSVQGRSAGEIFPYPDNLKLKSSLTLFAAVAEPASVFDHALERFFDGERDIRTLEILARLKETGGKDA